MLILQYEEAEEMKQLKIIAQLSENLQSTNGVKAAVLYGSFGRGDATPNSDVDIQILVDEHFDCGSLVGVLKKTFQAELLTCLFIALKNKIVVYFKSSPKAEIHVFQRYDDLKPHFLGSEITDVSKAILFDNTHRLQMSLQDFLERAVKEKQSQIGIDRLYIQNLIDKFIYQFENCSSMHRRGDAFHSYFFYNAAMHLVMQLKHIACGRNRYNFLPKKMNSEVLPKEELNSFYQLRGTLFLPEVNGAKRRLLDFFYGAIEVLLKKTEVEQTQVICEAIFQRDRLWNFRSIQLHNPDVCAPFYRSSTLSIISPELFSEIKKRHQIKIVIDLRAKREVEALPYSAQHLDGVVYHHIPFDPWNQPDWFKREITEGSNEVKAYKFFVMACKKEVTAVMRVLLTLKDSSALIHCHAGKDRTGIICSILHLLSGASYDTVQIDYLASESDTRPELLNVLLETIEQEGGIKSYLEGCGLSDFEIKGLKAALINL